MDSSLRWTALAMMMIGCGTETTEDPKLASPAVTHVTVGTRSSVTYPAPVCAPAGAPGTVEWELAFPPNAGGGMVAADAAGNVLFANGGGFDHANDGSLISLEGIVVYDATGKQRYAYPHGAVATLDAAGNAYLAGGFTAPIDLGTGTMMPMGNIDAYVVKLDASGRVVFATQLGLCGDEITSIAVDPSGRIAVSGAALGTVILDAAGKIERQLDFPGNLAFDSHGDLVIGGAFSGTLDLGGGHVLTTAGADSDGFLAKLDPQGNVVFSTQYGDAALPLDVNGWGGTVTVGTPRDQAVLGVATGPDDAIALIGAYRYEMSLAGQTLRTGPSFPSGQEAGTFLAKLDASGTPIFQREGATINAELPFGGGVIDTPFGVTAKGGTSVAMNALGNVIVSGNIIGDAQGPYAFPQLDELDGVTGHDLFSRGDGSGVSGYGLGVAADACGNILVVDAENTPSLFDQHVFLRKIAP